jgi:hypothetical protein
LYNSFSHLSALLLSLFPIVCGLQWGVVIECPVLEEGEVIVMETPMTSLSELTDQQSDGIILTPTGHWGNIQVEFGTYQHMVTLKKYTFLTQNR